MVVFDKFFYNYQYSCTIIMFIDYVNSQWLLQACAL